MSTKHTAELVSKSEWLGGKTVDDVRRFLSDNRLKLRKHAVGIMDMKKMQFTMRPIIQAWVPARRSYLTFEYANTPWFKSREERDAVFEAITTKSHDTMSTPEQQNRGAEEGLIYPPACPVTGRKYWGHLSHPKHGYVPVYGGPFGSYMIPVRVGDVGADHEWEVERYDQDKGEWMTEGFL